MTDVRVPDIGDFTDVPVIEIHVAPGDEVALDDPLVTLESDKATMDVPAPAAGVVKQLRVALGDRVSEGSVLLSLETSSSEEGGGPGGEKKSEDEAEAGSDDGPEKPADDESDAQADDEAESDDGAEKRADDGADAEDEAEKQADDGAEAEDEAEKRADDGADARAGGEPEARKPPSKTPRPTGGNDAQVVVLGAGPGGYTAAFRAADLGLKTILIERYPKLGGVCLNVGCIPSKALLHAAKVIADTDEMSAHGVSFGKPKVDLDALRAWKQSVVDKLTGGLVTLTKQRHIEVIHGAARFVGANLIEVGDRRVSFDNCVIAAGSAAASIPGLPDDPRIVDSTGALELSSVPKRLLVIGGGIIGLEMATVYDALGSRVTVVELMDQLIPGCDRDLVRVLQKRIAGRYEEILLGKKVGAVKAQKNGVRVSIKGESDRIFDQVLVAVGRRPNGGAIDAAAAGVEVDSDGFISVDRQMRTNVSGIYAIGDIVGGPMLAHKASHEGKVVAEVIAGEDVEFDARAIPSVAYTDPEVAWMGLTEIEAKANDIEYEKAVFPWAASGRALSLGRDDGATKLLLEPGSRRVLGAGIVGVNAGELIAETVHAIEMGADAEDLALTIHPHPTLSETVGFAAELATGTITDLMPPRRARR